MDAYLCENKTALPVTSGLWTTWLIPVSGEGAVADKQEDKFRKSLVDRCFAIWAKGKWKQIKNVN